MYRIFLFMCLLEIMAFDSDEMKYIDLLPDEEKQEFLNRVARRIIEEIQSKDSPEQSHAEVTNDELNAHDEYVQKLIKEESANLRNEKREISQKVKDEQDVNEDEMDSKALNEDKNLEVRDSSVNGENIHHIDLTMRNGDNMVNNSRRLDKPQNLNDNIDINTDSPFSVIPVKVIYDQDNVKSTNLTVNNASESVTNNLEQEDNIEATVISDIQYKNSNEETEPKVNEHALNNDVDFTTDLDQKNKTLYEENYDSSTTLPSKEIEEISSTNISTEIIQEDNKNYQETKDQPKIDSSNHEESTINTENYVKKSDSPETKIPDISKENAKYNKSTESVESSTKTESSTPVITGVKVLYGLSFFKPLTTIGLNSLPVLNNLHSSETDQEPTETADTTTIKGLTANPITKKHNKDFITNNKVKTEISINNSGEKEKPNKYFRKKLKILTENYSLEQVESVKKDDEKNDHNNGVGTYFVYEMPDDKPVFVQKPDLQDYEQPYYVPIYNFAPNNAYYKAYNNLGPNEEVDSDSDLTMKFESNSNHDYKDALDQDFYARNGFEIELRSKGNNNKKPYKYPTKKIQPKPKIFHQSYPNFEGEEDKYEPFFDTDYYFDNDNLRRQIGGYKGEDARWSQYLMGQQGLRSKVEDEPDFTIDKNIAKMVYGSKRRQNNINDENRETRRRRHRKRKHSARELPNSSEEDHPYWSIHKTNMKDHIRAVRKLLYKQKKFGYMPPSPYAIKTEPRYKRMFDAGHILTYKNDIKTPKKNLNNFHNSNIKNVAWDYYWGTLKNLNNTDFDDFTQIEEDKLNPMKVTNENKGYFNKMSNVRSKTNKEVLKTVNLDDLINVLKNMIRRDNKLLVSYNWLQTTVEINSAIKKLIDLTENAIKGSHIHVLDSDLLKYVAELYNKSNNILKHTNNIEMKKYLSNASNKLKLSKLATKDIQCILARMRILPKTKRRKPGEKIKNPLEPWISWNINFNRVRDKDKTPTVNIDVLTDFKDFLLDLQDNLYELHNSLKRIAFITTYKNQNWYQDVRNIFLKMATKRQLLQILLHLGTSKLINSIENSMKRREHYVIYIDNKEVVKEIQDNFVFLLSILERLDRKSIVNLARECRLE